jgi:sulfide:quinone oxidoreductase
MTTIKRLTDTLSVAPQISEADLATLAAQGFRSVINNRPDGESADQPASAVLAAAAARAGLVYREIPVVSGQLQDAQVTAFGAALAELPAPTLAFCRTGTRSTTLWALDAARVRPVADVVQTAAEAGYDLGALRPRLEKARAAAAAVDPAVVPASPAQAPAGSDATAHGVPARIVQILVVGGGSAGCAVAASLKRRQPDLDITIVEPSDKHYYQPGWTLAGAGAFDMKRAVVPTAQVIPPGVRWERAAVHSFQPAQNTVTLADGRRLGYRYLVVAPGLSLRWDKIEGLADTLGRNGVTSNYRFDLPPYTWKLVRELKRGRALFTQPAMPIKCAGAPQKAMYLSCDHWFREGLTGAIDVQFHNPGAVLFGVKEFVPPLMEYVHKYQAQLCFNSTLVAVDGSTRTAWFDDKDAAGQVTRNAVEFDMLHVVPPQTAPDFVSQSPLADAAGWLAVDQETLRHPVYDNIFSLGDVCSAPNAKTMAAVRVQAPVVAENLLAVMHGRSRHAVYNGYGACPLTVEKGRVVLAEFGYGGKLLPSFPLDPTKPSRFAWWLKAHALPGIYFHMVLRGREWLVHPPMVDGKP